MTEAAALKALGAPSGAVAAWEDMRAHLTDFGVTTPLRVAVMMGQCAHESGGFKRLSENMNYAASALPKIFRAFRGLQGEAAARKYGRMPGKRANQEMIASIAYADRLGNGSPATRDGWRYRGGGWLQLTGRDNYRVTGEAIGIDLEADPDRARTHEVSALIAGHYFSVNVWSYLRGMDLERAAQEATRRVNGPLMLGLEDRLEKTRLAAQAMAA